MSVSVVKINSKKDNFTIYIGRDWDGMKQSPFHNPFHLGKDGSREEVLLKFIMYWCAPEQWKLRKAALIMLQDGDTLGCYCYPKACHGDIIAGYVNWKQGRQLWL